MRRLFFGDADVKDGSKVWGIANLPVDGTIVYFTTPPGIRRIKIYAEMDYDVDNEFRYSASIKSSTQTWGSGYSEGTATQQDMESIVGVTPNKTYRLRFKCSNTLGVTFSWGKAINQMTPTVEDY